MTNGARVHGRVGGANRFNTLERAAGGTPARRFMGMGCAGEEPSGTYFNPARRRVQSRLGF